jgi:hydroxymethylpyrimidine pyrophosphatase-like HAD family hydrolase
MSKQLVFDLDGTILEERRMFERALAAPKQDIINVVNSAYDAGHTIIIYTARSWPEYEMTKKQLTDNNVKYHLLMCGKVVYDVWIDDRALNIDNIDKLKELL